MDLFYSQKYDDIDNNIDIFRELFNDLHPSLKFTVEKGKSSCEQNVDTLVEV